MDAQVVAPAVKEELQVKEEPASQDSLPVTAGVTTVPEDPSGLQQQATIPAPSTAPSTAVLTPEQLARFEKQAAEFSRQMCFLEKCVGEHYQATGTNVFENQGAVSTAVDNKPADPGLIKALAEGAVPPQPTAPVKSPRLEPQAEETFLAFFALQDTLTKETAATLAQLVGCEEGQAREFFSKTRSSVRSFLDRMMRKASGPHGELGPKPEQAHRQVVESLGPLVTGPAGLPTAGREAGLAAPDKEAQDRHARLERHRNYLDANGGIGHIEFVGEFAALMASERSWEVRTQQVAAVYGTIRKASVLKKLCAIPSFLPTLESWVLAAEADRQTSFLRRLIMTLAALPLSANSLCFISLPKTVAKLQQYRSPDVAEAATLLCEDWLNLLGGLEGVAAAGATAVPSASPGSEDVGTPRGAVADVTEQVQRVARAVIDPLAAAAPLGAPRGIITLPNLGGLQGPGVNRGNVFRPGAAASQAARPLTADEVVRGKKPRGSNTGGYLDFSTPRKPALKPLPGRPAPVTLRPIQNNSPALPADSNQSQRVRQAVAFRDSHRQQLEFVRRGRLLAEPTRAAAEKPLVDQMVATWQTKWPPPTASRVPHDAENDETDPPMPAAGEDSKQVPELDAIFRARGGGPIDYPSTATIPPCPLEAPQEAMPHRKVPIIPFLPQDPWDAESQNLRMYNAGVLLPELVDVSRALAFQKKMEAASVAQLPP